MTIDAYKNDIADAAELSLTQGRNSFTAKFTADGFEWDLTIAIRKGDVIDELEFHSDHYYMRISREESGRVKLPSFMATTLPEFRQAFNYIQEVATIARNETFAEWDAA